MTDPRFVITAERPNGRYIVQFDQTQVRLTYSQLSVMVRLVIARGTTITGYVHDLEGLYPKVMCCLRRTFDRFVRPGAGKQLIETGARKEYRLGLPIEEVGIAPSISELRDVGAMSDREVEVLRQICRVV